MKGFSLIEIVVALAVLSLLVAFLMPIFVSSNDMLKHAQDVAANTLYQYSFGSVQQQAIQTYTNIDIIRYQTVDFVFFDYVLK